MVSSTEVTGQTTPSGIDDSVARALASGFGGDVLHRGDAGFAEVAPVWNGMIEHTPTLIARCSSAQDVSRAVRFAADNNLYPAVRGGAHNIAGTATCRDGLVIDLSPMREVTVDPQQGRAWAGGGATWADLDRATQPHGLAAPGGLVSKTGIAGLTLGGGLGWLRRKHGLSCDNLVAAEVVTADGQIFTASEKENSDLLWGLRGGGGNFGVVTKFEYALHPVGPEVMFSFTLYPLESGRQVLQGWHEFCQAAPDEVTSIVLCGTVPEEEPFPPDIHRRQFVALATMYAGPVEDGRRILSPLQALGEPLCDFSSPAPYLEIQSNFDGDYPDGRRYYWKSLYLKQFDETVIDQVLQLAAERPSSLSTVDVWQLGGTMGRIPADATAFGDRGAPYLLGVESNWDDPAEDTRNRDWTRAACARMERFSNGNSYLNFEPDSVPVEQDSAREQRLCRLKRLYDPDNLFRQNHNIRPV
ncbi:FAD-binding oxidoreductase [Fodinicurvata halophila]|uniref:FAD-binding oxidoreductase n=1 Tax=Fodinicurvata halophila TaxID=1419723 RepID=A0ABV8UQA8_9PROT